MCSVCPMGIVLWSSWTFSSLNIMTCSPPARSKKKCYYISVLYYYFIFSNHGYFVILKDYIILCLVLEAPYFFPLLSVLGTISFSHHFVCGRHATSGILNFFFSKAQENYAKIY
jgi:hypothetical protein